MLFKLGVLKIFVKLTGKYQCRSLSLIIVWRLSFFETRLRHSCFIVNFVNFLKTTFLQNCFGRVLLSLWNLFPVSINLILFRQCGFIPKWKFKSSRSQMFFKIGVLKNFTNVPKKPVLQSLFILINLHS